MEPRSSIDIEGLILYCHHGVFPQERKVGNKFQVDMHLEFECSAAMRTDNIEGTINYADIIDLVRKQMDVPSKLLEHVAYRIYNILVLSYPTIISGRIRVSKLAPPVSYEIDRVSFTISW